MQMDHVFFMDRALELATYGRGHVSPNPMVGAVLVHDGRIIGEGFHERIGEAHAEVNCLRAVKPEDRQWIPESTLYVTLEPCAHFGRTPPCAALLIRERVKRVVVAMQDPFEKVSGKGIAMLKGAGMDVTLGVCET